MPRLTKILETYQLSWEDLRDCADEEKWKKRVNDSLALDFQRYCNKEAEKYQHPPLSWPTTPAPRPRIKQCLRYGGDLAIAALRMRCPHLRVLPSHSPSRHGVCRYCGHSEENGGGENGRHIFFCHAMPHALRMARDSIIQSITDESGIAPQHTTTTRKGASLIETYVINFHWPRQQPKTLKALLVFCRNLINHYASNVPSWESAKLARFPVRRARPVHRVAQPSSEVESSES